MTKSGKRIFVQALYRAGRPITTDDLVPTIMTSRLQHATPFVIVTNSRLTTLAEKYISEHVDRDAARLAVLSWRDQRDDADVVNRIAAALG